MSRVAWLGLATLTLLLAGCGRQATTSQVEGTSPPDESTSPSLNSSQVDQSAVLPQASTKPDWLVSLAAFSERFPTFAGYDFSLDRKQFIIYTSDNRSDLSRKMRDELMNLIDSSSGFPEVTDQNGSAVTARTLPFTYQRVKYPLSKLNKWRGSSRDFMYDGVVNKLSIDFMANVLNVQMSDQDKKGKFLSMAAKSGIPSDAVNITIGTNTPAKTLYDTFTPPVGGVNFQFGSPTDRCSIGLPVLANNVATFLTASHCSLNWGTSNDGSVMTQNAVRVGTKALDNPLYSCSSTQYPQARCQNADTTMYTAIGDFYRGRIIKTVGGTHSIDTGTSDTYYDVTTISERPGNNQTVSSIGASSGYREANVVSYDTDLAYEGFTPPRIIKNVVEVYKAISSAACGGDSGGPWFQITGTNTAKFLGITSGASTDAPNKTRPDGITVSCGYRAYFSPVAQIRVAYPNTTFIFTR
ncbi:S1 family peptidase [Deinococcus aestuarii]|uniref:S1 family peptidase n=1 Tax=Deinococcus aestuarii TaxID=2774531 RepID=UPI001C0C045B|nr:S1 family peptidase [Deinococcus aestuarii]